MTRYFKLTIIAERIWVRRGSVKYNEGKEGIPQKGIEKIR